MSDSSTDRFTVNVHELLEQRRQIALIWSVEDVQEMRPDLTDDQSWEVLKQCREVHDCNFGITWDLIDAVAESLFPEHYHEEGAEP